MASKLGIKSSRLHVAMHNRASSMLKQGTHPRVVQERPGPSTISVTLDIHNHVTPGLQKDAAERFDEVLNMADN